MAISMTATWATILGATPMRMTGDYFRDMQLILERVAPEVTQPPYIVRQSDLPRLPIPVDTSAYASRDPSPAQRQALQDAGLWRGPAPLVVFTENLTDRLEAYGRFLHELAHLLPFAPAADTAYTPIELEASLHAVTAWAAEGNAEIADLPRWAPHHGRQYVRVTCHLWFRALRLCCLDVPPRYIMHWEYDLSPLSKYLEALTGELRATDSSTPFVDIVAAPVPESFADRFNADKAAWLQWREGATV